MRHKQDGYLPPHKVAPRAAELANKCFRPLSLTKALTSFLRMGNVSVRLVLWRKFWGREGASFWIVQQSYLTDPGPCFPCIRDHLNLNCRKSLSSVLIMMLCSSMAPPNRTDVGDFLPPPSTKSGIEMTGSHHMAELRTEDPEPVLETSLVRASSPNASSSTFPCIPNG